MDFLSYECFIPCISFSHSLINKLETLKIKIFYWKKEESLLEIKVGLYSSSIPLFPDRPTAKMSKQTKPQPVLVKKKMEIIHLQVSHWKKNHTQKKIWRKHADFSQNNLFLNKAFSETDEKNKFLNEILQSDWNQATHQI